MLREERNRAERLSAGKRRRVKSPAERKRQGRTGTASRTVTCGAMRATQGGRAEDCEGCGGCQAARLCKFLPIELLSSCRSQNVQFISVDENSHSEDELVILSFSADVII